MKAAEVDGIQRSEHVIFSVSIGCKCIGEEDIACADIEHPDGIATIDGTEPVGIGAWLRISFDADAIAKSGIYRSIDSGVLFNLDHGRVLAAIVIGDLKGIGAYTHTIGVEYAPF